MRCLQHTLCPGIGGRALVARPMIWSAQGQVDESRPGGRGRVARGGLLLETPRPLSGRRARWYQQGRPPSWLLAFLRGVSQGCCKRAVHQSMEPEMVSRLGDCPRGSVVCRRRRRKHRGQIRRGKDQISIHLFISFLLPTRQGKDRASERKERECERAHPRPPSRLAAAWIPSLNRIRRRRRRPSISSRRGTPPTMRW